MYWLLLSLVPFVENRGAIPLAILTGVNPFIAWIASSFLSFLGGFATYLFLEKAELFIRETPLRMLYERFLDRVRKKGKYYVDRYGELALFLFVALPLPGSGAYSGSLFAYLFDLPPSKTAIGLLAGAFVAGLLVLTASVSLGALV